jgi:hypothetical protein
LRISLKLCHAALSPEGIEQEMQTKAGIRTRNSRDRRIEGAARAEAERQARRIPWPTLLEYREKYIEWEGLTLWASGIEEADHQAPGWLRQIIEGRCPGIKLPKGTKLWKCLDNWKQETVFAKPNSEGWMRGVSFFAVRDLEYARTWAYWEYCERQWSVRRPASYPSFEEWKSAADNCPEEVLESSGLREERKELIRAARRAGRERLEQAVGTYLDIEAFTCWLRAILEVRLPLSGRVREEIENRYPILDIREDWNRVWDCLKSSHFQQAQVEGWFDAVVYTAELHPRRMKVIDYLSLYWSVHWPKGKPASYPSFELWRREAESYVPDACDTKSSSPIASRG